MIDITIYITVYQVPVSSLGWKGRTRLVGVEGVAHRILPVQLFFISIDICRVHSCHFQLIKTVDFPAARTESSVLKHHQYRVCAQATLTIPRDLYICPHELPSKDVNMECNF